MSGVIEGMIIAAAISGAATAGGAMMTNEANSANATAANEAQFKLADANRRDAHNTQLFNRDEARWMAAYNQQFAERLSSTAYQRATQDMRQAGLNPILAYTQGGASSPSAGGSPGGAPAFSGGISPQVPRLENSLGQGVSSALQAAQGISSVRQATATTENTQQTTINARQSLNNLRAEEQQINANTAYIVSQLPNAEVRRAMEQELTRESQSRQREQAMRTRTEEYRGDVERERASQNILQTEHQRRFGAVPSTLGNEAGAAAAMIREGNRASGGRVESGWQSFWNAMPWAR